MLRRELRGKTLVSWLTRLVLIVILFQTMLIAAILVFGGVLDEARSNAYQAFYEKVNNRREYLQREMRNRWTNMDPYVNDLRKSLTSPAGEPDRVFEASVDTLLDMLRACQVTGVYVVLNEPVAGGERYPALYIRDYDPLSNNGGSSDLYMLCGPSNLARKLRVPLDQTWQYHLALREGSRAFVDRPLKNTFLTTDPNLLGYWSPPFRLSENDVEIITYSRPLYDDRGTLRGVIGIEVTLNYLAQFLPPAELQPRDSLGYLIAMKNGEGQPLLPVITGGPLQKRMIDVSGGLEMTPLDAGRNIFQLKSKGGGETLYANAERMGLYQPNTPFEAEQWYLVGFMREDSLLGYVNRINWILQFTMVLAVVIGALGGTAISYQMTRPITSLVRQVQESEQNKELRFSPTGFMELDRLAAAVESANRQMLDSASRLSRVIEISRLPIGAFEINRATGGVFVTEQTGALLGLPETEAAAPLKAEVFAEALARGTRHPEPEEQHTYRLAPDQDRWVRIETFEGDETTIGIVMDVTEEILDKREIRRDRDLDPLTRLYNRKGFQWRFQQWRQQEEPGVSALMMVDLDNLKQVNDTYGHHFGDQYILRAVESLRHFTDPGQMLLGRRSGDEFVLLLHGFSTREALLETVAAYFQALGGSGIEMKDGTIRPVQLSAGLKWINSPSEGYEELLHYADEALYHSKRKNKGSYTVSAD